MSIQMALLGTGGLAPLQVTADNVIGARLGLGTATGTGSNTTVTGGLAPYTYSWAFVSGDSGISIDSPFIQNPTWSFTFVFSPESTSATWRVTVTDSGGSAPATADITVDLNAI